MKITGSTWPVQIGIVGPCTSGKSTLIKSLDGQFAVGLRHIAQEHSYVPTMWQRINPPDRLVYLDVSYSTSLLRRPSFNWTVEEYQEQLRRLAHAREHADLYLQTDDLPAAAVAGQVAEFLVSIGINRID